MLEPEIAASAHSLLANVIVSLMEDEHLSVVTPQSPNTAEDHAMQLRQLGTDIAELASALLVIRRRGREAQA